MDGENDAFSPIRRIAVDKNGQLYVLMPQEHRVAVFSEDGAFVESLGRWGEGPGEFSHPIDLGFLGDTLWVLDPLARRVSFFLDLQFLKSLPLEIPGDIHPERNARAVAVLDNGGVLLVTDSQSMDDPLVTSTPSLILVQRSESLDTLATYSTDYTAGMIVRRSGGEIVAVRPFPQPFSGGDQWAVAQDGSLFVLVEPDAILPEQTSSQFSVILFRSTGDTVYHARVPYEAIRMPDDLRM
jgi:hypothetical protein